MGKSGCIGFFSGYVGGGGMVYIIIIIKKTFQLLVILPVRCCSMDSFLFIDFIRPMEKLLNTDYLM